MFSKLPSVLSLNIAYGAHVGHAANLNLGPVPFMQSHLKVSGCTIAVEFTSQLRRLTLWYWKLFRYFQHFYHVNNYSCVMLVHNLVFIIAMVKLLFAV